MLDTIHIYFALGQTIYDRAAKERRVLEDRSAGQAAEKRVAVRSAADDRGFPVARAIVHDAVLKRSAEHTQAAVAQSEAPQRRLVPERRTCGSAAVDYRFGRAGADYGELTHVGVETCVVACRDTNDIARHGNVDSRLDCPQRRRA